MIEKKISSESAQAQVDILVNHYDLGEETEGSEVGAVESRAISKIKRAIELGLVEIKIENGDLKITQYLTRPLIGGPTEINYREVDGRSKIAMKDSHGDDHGKLYAFLGGLSGQGSQVIMALKGKDLTIAENLGLLFLTL